MKKYLFLIFCLLVYAILICCDYYNKWPAPTEKDILTLASFLTIYFTTNYAISYRFQIPHLYRDYRTLIITPVMPAQCFFKEFTAYLKNKLNLIFFLSTYLFFIYFIEKMDEMTIIKPSVSFILYFAFFLYILIIIRFACGHFPKGKNLFNTICLVLDSMAMYQIALINNESDNLYKTIITEFNPLNTLFFYNLIKGRGFWLTLILYSVLVIVLFLFTKRLSWERHMNHT